MFLSGVLVRNGGSFEDDLSLGAEGTYVCGRMVFSYGFKIQSQVASGLQFSKLNLKILKMAQTHFTEPFLC